MRKLSNPTGSNSYGETSWETGGPPDPPSGKNPHQELIRKANSVPLIQVLRYYRLNISASNNVIVCPFKSHKGGRETTGSFKYYAHTNSFNCFGCHTGGSCCEFVSAMDGINKNRAAAKIIELFKHQVNQSTLPQIFNSSEVLEIMLEFSDAVREFYQTYFDEESKAFIDVICKACDELYVGFNTGRLDADALRRVIKELKARIDYYKSCLTP